jgi:D-alanyl-D-alanine carboxypeptidase
LKSVCRNVSSGAFRWIALGLCLTATLAAGKIALAGSHNDTPSTDEECLKEALHQDLADFLSERSTTEHISTVSLNVTFRGSREEISDAVGTTEYGGGQPVTPDSLFQIGSNTKVFTSAILLRLEAEGVLSIDDTLARWLPQYPAWNKVTIRQLLNMTSGIPTYDSTPGWSKDYGDNPYRKFTPEDLIAYVYPTIKTHNPKWEYSNTGYILAQMIIDKASWSHSYQAEVERLIVENHLSDTYYESDFYPGFVNRRLVSGYYVNTDDADLEKLLGTDTKNYSLGWAQGAGGIISNPRDLSRWVRALFEGDVLQPQQKEELESLVSIPDAVKIPTTSDKYPLAFGLGIGQKTGKPLGLQWFYLGSTIGYRALYVYLPDSGVIVSVFTNSQTASKLNTLDSKLMLMLYETLKKYGKVVPRPNPGF